MKRQVQGIAFILFGMLLALIAAVDPWVPIVGGVQPLLLLLAVILGIIGLVFSLSKDNSDK